MQKNILVILCLLSLIGLTETYGQERYLDSLFAPVKSHRNVLYAQAEHVLFPVITEDLTTTLGLRADIYQPADDNNIHRPCIIYAHGGSFLVGSKNDFAVVEYAKAMASRGYVVMTINYRMGYNALDKESVQRADYRGVQDMKAAIRYAKEHALSIGVDPNKIIVAGNSAGGIMSVHTAYFDQEETIFYPAFQSLAVNDCLSCSGNDFDQDDLPMAVANLWGGIADTTFIEPNNPIPIISFHGTEDRIVYIDENSPYNLPTLPTLQGSDLVQDRLHHLGIKSECHIFEDKGHEPWGLFAETAYFDFIVDKSSAFFYKILLEKS